MKKHKRKELGLTALILLGTGFALAVIAVMALFLAITASMTKNPTALTGAFSLVALLLSGAISGFITSRVNGEGGVLIGILSSVMSAFIIMIVGLVWKRGIFNIGAFLNTLSFVAASALFSLLGKKRVKRSRHRYT